MGIVFTRLFSLVFGNREARILVLGVPARSPYSISRTYPFRPLSLLESPQAHRGSTVLFCEGSQILILPCGLVGFTDRLQMGEVVSTIPTIGFNVETVQYNNIKFQVWGLGGQTSIRLIFANMDMKKNSTMGETYAPGVPLKFTIVLLLKHLVTLVTIGAANQFAFGSSQYSCHGGERDLAFRFYVVMRLISVI